MQTYKKIWRASKKRGIKHNGHHGRRNILTRKAPESVCFHGLWRRRWDSNPRALAGYLISSQARYDHFDTPPWEIYSVFSTDNTISSQPRYDHFDTAAYSAVQARLAPLRRGLFRIADCFKKIKSFGDLFSQFSLQAQEGAQCPAVAGPRRGSRSSALLSRSDDVPHSVQDHGRAVGVGFQRLRRGDA